MNKSVVIADTPKIISRTYMPCKVLSYTKPLGFFLKELVRTENKSCAENVRLRIAAFPGITGVE